MFYEGPFDAFLAVQVKSAHTFGTCRDIRIFFTFENHGFPRKHALAVHGRHMITGGAQSTSTISVILFTMFNGLFHTIIFRSIQGDRELDFLLKTGLQI